MLILDIFALRAQSHEGKVQVELAQLKYLSTRLVGMNQDMGQQKYAVGARGPGETQLELDRRKLDKRVRFVERALEKLQPPPSGAAQVAQSLGRAVGVYRRLYQCGQVHFV